MAAPEILAKRRYEARVNAEALLKELAPRYGVAMGRLWANNHPGAPETNALTLLEALTAVVAKMDAELETLRASARKKKGGGGDA